MKYYLETNALYSIGKVTPDKIAKSFTSALALVELISGVNGINFEKRQNILKKIIDSSVFVDWKMPEQIIFESFNALCDYCFDEKRIEPLQNLIGRMLYSSDFYGFANSYEYKCQKYNFKYFKELDTDWSKGFVDTVATGNGDIKQAIFSAVAQNQNKIYSNGNVYVINKPKDLGAFFCVEHLLNRSITFLALLEIFKSILGDNFNEKEVYDSYNGLIDFYIDGFSNYQRTKLATLDASARNDFFDLTHLVYLRNNKQNFIVSNDNIFNVVLGKQAAKIEELTR